MNFLEWLDSLHDPKSTIVVPLAVSLLLGIWLSALLVSWLGFTGFELYAVAMLIPAAFGVSYAIRPGK